MDEKQIMAKAKYYAMEYIEHKRPPLDMRHKLDLGFSLENRELVLFEIRPRWNDPSEIFHSDFAKAKYIKSRGIWKIFWKRANGNWQTYDPEGESEIEDIIDFFRIVDEDKYHAFWG